LIILTNVTLARSNSALPDDGDDVGTALISILMQILKLFLRQFNCASVGRLKIFENITVKMYDPELYPYF
jgi:hypothetical protein